MADQQVERPVPNTVPLDVESKLTQLERLVADAKTVPLSSSIMFSRADIEQLLSDLRKALPEELRQARWLVKEREELLEKSEREATRLLEEARRERSRLIAKTEVLQAANREADRLLEEAQEQARQMRLEAEDYVDAKLANFEVVLHKTLAAVERGREKLRGRLDADELADDDVFDDEDDLE